MHPSIHTYTHTYIPTYLHTYIPGKKQVSVCLAKPWQLFCWQSSDVLTQGLSQRQVSTSLGHIQVGHVLHNVFRSHHLLQGKFKNVNPTGPRLSWTSLVVASHGSLWPWIYGSYRLLCDRPAHAIKFHHWKSEPGAFSGLASQYMI